MGKRLEDEYSGRELELMRFDLEGAVREIQSWLNGGEVDPDLLGYVEFLISSMALRFPQSIEH